MLPKTKPVMMDERTLLAAVCLLIIATYALMIDLKGISADEGIRLAIMNGGKPFVLNEPPAQAGWTEVLVTGSPYAYQPLYYLIQNTLMRVARTHDVVFLRLLNIFFLWISLQGLLCLSAGWRLVPRVFLLGLFAFNAYLFMHVLQIREYIAGVAFYVWFTWLVLRLLRRELVSARVDVPWFVAYGVLLTLGFYVQSWVVFPAIGQFLFLLVRPSGSRLRFYAHLALSYFIVLTATWPYLQSHQQRINVGRWGSETSALWPQLSDGLHLVLSGHLTGHSRFTEFLTWFWLAVVAGAALLLFNKRFQAVAGPEAAEFKKQGSLMALCVAVPLTFQIGYFFKVDSLSVWPRYFVIHYFFATWLIALSFNFLHTLWAARATSLWIHRSLTAAVGVILAMMVSSGIYQTRSYYQDPLFDTGLSPASNWRVWARELSRVVQPDDVVILHDFISRSTLTFTRPMANRLLLLSDLEKDDLQNVNRLVYLESVYSLPEREGLIARMTALGFGTMQENKMYSADGRTVLSQWQVLVFTRRAVGPLRCAVPRCERKCKFSSPRSQKPAAFIHLFRLPKLSPTPMPRSRTASARCAPRRRNFPAVASGPS